jgi:hypothetical protein
MTLFEFDALLGPYLVSGVVVFTGDSRRPEYTPKGDPIHRRFWWGT